MINIRISHLSLACLGLSPLGYMKGYGNQLGYMKGYGNQSLRYLEGPLIKIFQTDAIYGCIILIY